MGYSVESTIDGGYVIAGQDNTSSAGIYLVKTDGLGNLEWDRHYGRSGADYARDVAQTRDSGYIVTGVSLLKTDAKGYELWEKDLDGGTGYSVEQTSDGGYIVAGSRDDCLYLLKTDANGNRTWDRDVRGLGDGRSVRQTDDGGYIVAGRSDLIKTDGDGNTTWIISTSSSDSFYDVLPTVNGGYLTVGGALLTKFNSGGYRQWLQSYEDLDHFLGFSVQPMEDGGYLIAGQSGPFTGGRHGICVVRTDGNGTRVWNQTLVEADDVYGYSMVKAGDGGYVIAGGTVDHGATPDGVYLVKLK